MIVGLIFIAIIWSYFLSFLVVYYNCNMGTDGLPDIYTLRPVALMLWVSISGKPLVSTIQYQALTVNNWLYEITFTILLQCKIFMVFIYAFKIHRQYTRYSLFSVLNR